MIATRPPICASYMQRQKRHQQRIASASSASVSSSTAARGLYDDDSAAATAGPKGQYNVLERGQALGLFDDIDDDSDFANDNDVYGDDADGFDNADEPDADDGDDDRRRLNGRKISSSSRSRIRVASGTGNASNTSAGLSSSSVSLLSHSFPPSVIHPQVPILVDVAGAPLLDPADPYGMQSPATLAFWPVGSVPLKCAYPMHHSAMATISSGALSEALIAVTGAVTDSSDKKRLNDNDDDDNDGNNDDEDEEEEEEAQTSPSLPSFASFPSSLSSSSSSSSSIAGTVIRPPKASSALDLMNLVPAYVIDKSAPTSAASSSPSQPSAPPSTNASSSAATVAAAVGAGAGAGGGGGIGRSSSMASAPRPSWIERGLVYDSEAARVHISSLPAVMLSSLAVEKDPVNLEVSNQR